MASFFNYDNKFSSSFNQALNIFCIGLFWLFSSIPIFTIGAASSAAYYTMNKVVRHHRGYVWQEYWSAFRSNFKQGTVIGLIFLVFAVLMGVELYLTRVMAEAGSSFAQMWMIFALLLILELMVWFYIYPNIARFQNTNKAIIKNSILMAVANLPQTVLMFVFFAVLLLGIYYLPLYLKFLNIIAPGIFFWVQNRIMEKILRKYMSEEDQAAEDERNREYFN